MTQRDDEFGDFGEYIRRSLQVAADSVVVGEGGIDRVRGRLGAVRPGDVARPGWRAAPAAPASCRRA